MALLCYHDDDDIWRIVNRHTVFFNRSRKINISILNLFFKHFFNKCSIKSYLNYVWCGSKVTEKNH